MGDVDNKKILVSNKISFGENYKYFIGYSYNGNKVKPLNKMVPKSSTYVKSYDGKTKLMYFFWDKVSPNIKKEFDGERVYNINYWKTKIKPHGDEVTDFYDKKIPKIHCNHTCLAVISWDSALKKDENYYPQMFLKECKYFEKKVVRHIHVSLSGFFLFF